MTNKNGNPAAGGTASGAGFVSSANSEPNYSRNSGGRKAVPILPNLHGDANTAALVQDELNELARDAFAAQGARAFENTERATAFHEAGHAVVATASGRRVARVRIKRRRVGDLKVWLGHTDDGVFNRTDEATSVDDDCFTAANIIAGWVAEILFDTRDMRAGSSLDEIIIFRGIVANIAFKTGRPHTEIAAEVIHNVGAILKRHRDLVERLAAALMRVGTLRGARLARLLAEVGGCHESER